MTRIIPTNTYGIAKFLVSPDESQGNFTTIQAAVTAASAGDTIYIADGVYNESVTLKPGILITALSSSGDANNVEFTGSFTFTGGGDVIISNIRMTSDNGVSIDFSGSSAGSLSVIYCFLDCTSNYIFDFTNSNANSSIDVNYSFINVSTNSTSPLFSSSAGSLSFSSSFLVNTATNFNNCQISNTIMYLSNSTFGMGLSISDGSLTGKNSNFSSLSTLLNLNNSSAQFINSELTGNIGNGLNHLFDLDATSNMYLLNTTITEAVTGPSPNFDGTGNIEIYSVYPIGTTVLDYGSNTVTYKELEAGNILANSLTTTTFITTPAASTSSSLALGAAYQNTLGYDVLLTVYVNISNTTNANFLLGVGPTSTPTQQNILTNYNITPSSTHLVFPVPIYLPNNYYALLSTTGTVTANIIGQLAMPI